MIQIYPLGEQAVVLQLGKGVSTDLHEKVTVYQEAIFTADFPWVKELIPAYDSITVFYDLGLLRSLLSAPSIFDWVSAELKKIELVIPLKKLPSSIHTIPVCYDTSLARDIETVAALNKVTVHKLIDLHASETYTIYMLGFLPGFPYMGTVPQQIQTPRKPNPEALVPKGSVGIAGAQTGIYPIDSPGGWQIIGRTPIPIFNLSAENPCLFTAGDRVQFEPISLRKFADLYREGTV